MLEESAYVREQNNKRVWAVSLGISLFCCVIFSGMIVYYVSTLGNTLNTIDNRLATLESRGVLPSLPPSAAAVPMPESDIPSAAPLAEPASLHQETVPSAPPPSNEAPPAAPEQQGPPQMSLPPGPEAPIPSELP
jgi:hypothetical protein